MRNIIIASVLCSVLLSVTARADEVQIRENAPDRYTVVKGDTLWGISGRFLKNPWKWPQVWKMNREQIRNPHWIYPGDVIVLDRASGTLRLERGAHPTVKLRPEVRAEANNGAIPSISPSDIGPFLTKPLVIEENGMDKAPRIVATEESRVIAGSGNTIYADNLPEGSALNWQVYRPGKALVDPDNGKTLGYEAIYLGNARIKHFGKPAVAATVNTPAVPATPATLEITKSTEEILKGDRLVVAPDPAFPSYVPHAPEQPIKARVISAIGGIAEFGQNAIVALSRGDKEGVEVGHVLALYRAGTPVKADGVSEGQLVLPDERYGLVFVFRTFDHISYALVVRTNRPVQIKDVVENP